MIDVMNGDSASDQIDDIIGTYGGWKADILSRLRKVIKSADPDAVEEVKWKTASRPEGLPVWSHDGILCIAETWKDNVKLVFFKGALLDDPSQIFNARLRSSTDRAIEYREGSAIDEASLSLLVDQAVELNKSKRENK